jgi:hypothetical protein
MAPEGGVGTFLQSVSIVNSKEAGDISFNTFNTSSQVATPNVNDPNPGGFHTIKGEAHGEDGEGVSIKFYLHGSLVTTQYGKGFVGCQCTCKPVFNFLYDFYYKLLCQQKKKAWDGSLL